ncbi:MAG TPA: hypothetical protein HPP77_10990 [Candidatus Hydrogenedentes bacterium]|nr:hypothetical protein [Candidatus Hydrogenedentota bacterium]
MRMSALWRWRAEEGYGAIYEFAAGPWGDILQLQEYHAKWPLNPQTTAVGCPEGFWACWGEGLDAANPDDPFTTPLPFHGFRYAFEDNVLDTDFSVIDTHWPGFQFWDGFSNEPNESCLFTGIFGPPYECKPWDENGDPIPTSYHRIKEGIERFFITDINNPAATNIGQSDIPVMFDVYAGWSDHPWRMTSMVVLFNHAPGGSNFLYMDGHVEFIRYAEWPKGQFPCSGVGSRPDWFGGDVPILLANWTGSL